MLIRFMLPAMSAVRNGNSVTAERWRGHLEALGHRVLPDGDNLRDDAHQLLVVFNGFKNRQRLLASYSSAARCRLVVCLTGTDLYRDHRNHPESMDVLQLAHRLVLLQPRGLDELPSDLHGKTSVIYQSATCPVRLSWPEVTSFQVCVISHLRPEKDPLRAAAAVRLLAPESRIRLVHVGRALSHDYAVAATAEAAQNPRFFWYGEQSSAATSQILQASRLLVLTSFMEGGGNVVGEAIVAGVPVLVSDIPAMRGLLGDRYPGLFPAGDSVRLAELLQRAEVEADFYQNLQQHCRRLAWKFDPLLERLELKRLMSQLFADCQT